MKVEKKFIIYSLFLILITSIGFSSAYLIGNITGNKQAISVNTSLLTISGDGVVNTTINASSSYTKTITVNNTASKTYKYNIVLTDYTSGSGVKYKITSTNGYNMTDYSSINISKDEMIIAYSVEIPSNTIHTYTLEIKNTNTSGVSFNGILYISEGTALPSLTLVEAMLRDNPTVSERADFSISSSADVTGTIYKTNKTEDGSIVYYYSGVTNNNWVYFAGTYWRIIRTNEDGSVRIMMDRSDISSSTCDENLGYRWAPMYSIESNSYAYVGYKYSLTGIGMFGDINYGRGNTTNSEIKVKVDSYYSNSILTNYDKYVSKTAIYCSDRSSVSKTTWGSVVHVTWGGYQRLTTNKTPTYKCGGDGSGGLFETTQAVEDKFSASTEGGGNGALTYPIALITADELVFAGITSSSGNKSNSFITKDFTASCSFWTMTPQDTYSLFYYYTSGGTLGNCGVDCTHLQFAPVLSIDSCAKFNGSGIKTDPYIIDETNSTC